MKRVSVLLLTLTLMMSTATANAMVVPQAKTVVDEVITLKKAGIDDDIILSKLRKDAKATQLSTDDLIKLKTAGVNDEIVRTIMNPSASPAPAAAAPAASAPAPAPAAAAAPAAAPVQAAAAAPAPAAGGAKKKIAIAPFKFSAPMDELQAAFGTADNIGTGVKAIMTEQISQAGKLSVVESDLGFLNQELALGSSGSVKQGSGPRMGQMQGAELALQGDILIFGRDDQKKSGALGGFGGGIGGLLGGGAKSNKAVVVISYRLINIETREVLLSAQARGESKREDKNMFGAIVARGAGVGGRVDMTSSNFAQTILGEATIDSVNKLAAAMMEKAASLPTRFVEVEGRVAAINGSQVTIAVGANDGVQVGDVFEISKVLSEIKDPVTGEVLDLQLQAVGTLTIVDARPRISIGNYVGSPAANNFIARKKRQ